MRMADGYVAGDLAAAAVEEPAAPTMRDRMAYADLKLWVADESNLRVDRATMASGVEARCPFLDVPLAEYMLSLPFEAKVRGGRTKALLRDAFASELPEAITAARKRGFQSPARSWVQQTLAATVDDVLSRQRLDRVGLLNGAGVQALRQDQTVPRMPRKLWALVVLQLWGEAFLT
jgi:asparagine synthase (glutamine-hydrolysing)